MEMGFLEKNIGIIGCGHLGLTFAKRLMTCNLRSENLRVSHHGNDLTQEKLKQVGLVNNNVTNRELCEKSDVVFIAVKPSDISNLEDVAFRDDCLIISCVAGLKRDALQKHWQHEVQRIMPSSPLTIEAGSGVAAIYPTGRDGQAILSAMGFQIYQLPGEDTFDLFTATVCLPAAFLFMQLHQQPIDEGEVLNHFGREYDRFAELYRWARKTTPPLHEVGPINAYLKRMATPGGITERMLQSLTKGNSLFKALKDAIAKSREIAVSLV